MLEIQCQTLIHLSKKDQRMKKMQMTALLLGMMAAGIFAFKGIDNGGIKGTVNPAEGAVQAWAFSGTDTVKAPVTDGAFELTGLKAGDYKLEIEAKAPFKNATRENISVTEGQTTDIGEIRLDQ